MTVTVLIYAITGDYSGTYGGLTYDTGDKVNVIFDTITLALSIELYDFDGTLKGTPTSGPNLTAFRNYELVTEEPFYRYCDGTTLKYISDKPQVWPYAELLSTPNHYTCVADAPVCDLVISSEVSITSASSPTSNDGALTVTATSSAGGSNTIENGDFYDELDPASSVGSGNAWTWSGAFSGCAFNELPASLSPTQRLRIPYQTIGGVTYEFELSTRSNNGGGGAGNYTDWKLYLTDGLDFSNVQTEANKPLGTSVFTITITPSSDMPYIEITAEANNVAGQLREVLVLKIDKISSNGGVKFSLTDFDYQFEGQSSGTFSALLPGVYTIYARDANGCFDTISVRVPVTNTYGEYYRLEFDDNNDYAVHRVDILKRGFSGSVTEICGADVPLRISYNGQGEGKYSPLVGSSAIVGLLSESNQQFAELFTGDDRQFQVKYYRDGALRWIGYIIPSMYEEPYIAPPYPVFFTATDGIGDLKSFKFLNDVEDRYRGDVSQMFVIKEALKKLDLQIDIHSGINVYEVDMDQTDSDDPLTQAYVDTDSYYSVEPEETPDDCDTVLQKNIKSYGARLFQAYGKWWIVRTQEMVASFDYRVFNYEGVYQSNSGIDPLEDFSSGSDINRAVPRDKAGLLMIAPGYGKITLTYELGLRNNLIKSGEFEEDDLIPTGVGTQTFFADWTIEQNTAGITYGLEKVNNGDSLGAFYMDFLTASDNEYNLLKATLFEIDAAPTDKLKFTFQYLVRPSINAPWVRFGYKLIATGGAATFYYTANPLFNTSITSPWQTQDVLNEVYATKFNEWVKIELPMKAVEDATHVELRFYLQANNRVDYSSTASLPDDLIFGSKRTVGDVIGGDDSVRYYTFTDTNEPDDSPNLVVAGDGAWKLDQTIRFSQDFSILNSILLDNVIVEYLPNGENPKESSELLFNNNASIKTNYEEDFQHGDVLDDNANNKNIYKGYLRFTDGTPTELWSSEYVAEEPLLEVTLQDYASQLTIPNYRIQAPIFYDIDLTFLTTFEDQFDSGRQYVFSAMDSDVFNNTSNVEMLELKAPSEVGPSFSNAYSDDYNSGQ